MAEIKVTCRGADTLPIDRILEFQGKLKHISQTNKDRLKSSILRHGFTAPLFVWDDHGEWRLLDGHQRLATLLSMRKDGYDIPMLPVDYIEAIDEKEAREKLLNITSQYGEFDMDELNEWVSECDEELQQSLRLVDEELELSVNSTEEVETVGDDDVNEDVEPITKLGDLWELGEHRLLCGDSTDSETVDKLMDGQKSDIIFTDPPYGMSYGGGRARGDHSLDKKTGGVKVKAHGMIIGDDLKGDDLLEMVSKSIECASNISKEGSAKYICFTWRTYNEFHDALTSINVTPKACIVWDKKSIGLGQCDYRPQHEFIFYCGGQWYGNKAQSDVWYSSRGATGEYVHPTQKPVELIEKALLNSSKSEDIVHDCFGGSGSTLIASQKTGRLSRIMELDPKYCDVIVNRYKTWCENNGKTPIIKLNGEVYQWDSSI